MSSKCPVDHTKFANMSNEEVSQAVMAARAHTEQQTAVKSFQQQQQQPQEELKCPIIHAVNDEEAKEANASAAASSGGHHGSAPFFHHHSGMGGGYVAAKSTSASNPMEGGDGALTEKASALDFEREFEDEVPTMRQYKKLKRTTQLITDFYRSGTEMKGENMRVAQEDLERLDVDKQMATDQLEALNSKAAFKGHLKWKEINGDLEKEIETMNVQREMIEKHAEKCKELHEWSKGIVKICEWLALNLDNYCVRFLDLPKNITSKIQPVPELTEEEATQYGSGLDEIMHNLNESRDFFQAAVDGRLDQYYRLEKQMIEEQLEALEKYPADNPRREYTESTLKDDLEQAIAQIESGEEEATKKRRKYMLDLHLDFLKVLTFFKERLKLLNASDREQREYDATFTTTFVLSDE